MKNTPHAPVLIVLVSVTVLVEAASCQVNQQIDASAVDPPTTAPRVDNNPSSSLPLEPTSVVAPEVSPDVEQWLGKIERAASKIRTLQAKLRYDRTQGLVGDHQRRFGRLIYFTGPPARFVIHFDYLLVDRRLDREDRSYIFDGQWLIERYDKEKLFIRRQVAPAPQPGDDRSSADLLALGQGPFPLPVSQKKDQVLERFEVTLVEPADSDPANSVHFHLTPKHDHDHQLTQVDLWYDRDTLLPVRIATLDESENESVVEITQPKLNVAVDPAVVDTTAPQDLAWRVEVIPWSPDGP